MNQHVDRRALLASSTAAAAAVAAVVTATQDARAKDTSVSPELERLIAAKGKAYSDFDCALAKTSEFEEAYFAKNKKELVVDLSIGGAQSFNVSAHFAHFDVFDHYRDVRADIIRRYEEQHRKLAAIAKIAPATAAEATAALRKAEANDTRVLRQVLRDEVDRRKAFGLWQVEEAQEAASQADLDTFTAICAYRCRTFADITRKAEVLAHYTGQMFAEIQAEDFQVLLASMMPADEEGGAV
ncbi:hypothetical protein MesoLj131a_03030 [Mesorhizobium sp. 131-2-1]|nr:hypothetical protein MesoLj131a_03030 [Mesorhizobium sp. 131-2-1]